MKFLFRELFKRLRIRYIILILLVLFVFSYISIFSKNTINMLSNEFPLEKSPNPQATEHFIKAMEYKNYILNLHRFVNYDNFLMKPLLTKMDEEYEKGKSLLPETSAEDVYWYVILYRGIYGIGGIPDDNDMSMAFKTTLTKEDYKKHYEEIVDKIKRFAINDFNYDVPRVTEYKFGFMENLIDEFFISSRIQIKDFINNKKYLEDLMYIYPIYKDFSNKYLVLSKQKLSPEFLIFDEIKFLIDIIILNAYQNNNTLICNNNENLVLIDKLRELSISKNKDKELKFIFDGHKRIFKTIKLMRYCPNLEKQVDEIFIHFVDRTKE
ncbi:hypothetical protein [Aliarcobacter butzleri]|uniref:Uncharacterized protein n=1 Tax=Aliarcobacter butzleri TaxID=28197 RepID=A0AAW7Q625_9BACT|nr:hypothetical protein [Aliarcobacter butzleri]MDN5114423.1 hypothetical protein [Aliarcobacter butzleri]